MLNVITLLGENEMMSMLVIAVFAAPTVIIFSLMFNDGINAICGK
tara:strand:+ start:169 stop:303 length:135 start_codon:yes stop_codon:yes gene_type:complete